MHEKSSTNFAGNHGAVDKITALDLTLVSINIKFSVRNGKGGFAK